MATPLVPQRSSLVAQTVAVLERGLSEGRWHGQLPGQHALCAQLMISRTTLRAALQEIAQRGLIDLAQGLPTTIRRNRPGARKAPAITRAVLLLPEPLWRLRPAIARWAGELRPLLQRGGLELELREGGPHYGRQPARSLERLLTAHPRAAWVLFGSSLAMQQWFAARGVPAVLAGSAFPGIELPSVEYDHAAIAQHAAAQLAAAGHRRTAILLQRTGSAADRATCDAFARAGTPAPLVLEHDGSLPQIEARLRRLAQLAERPTALFVTKSHAVPAALTILPRLGLEIPRDLSVICREDDPFLGFLVPAVARYSSDASAIARKLARALTRLAAGQPARATHERIMPRFVDGHSLGPPRGPGE
ncbi:MAG: substrate-binding domain-containing protein [Opitutaceae bacterium]|nr:substrate-binding domain-containing protein [Opitutaceae bacterium]